MRVKAHVCWVSVTGLVMAACTSGPDAGPAAGVVLDDSTDTSGKADAIGGRTIIPVFTGERYLEGELTFDGLQVSDMTDDSMRVEGPLIVFGPTDGLIQITIDDPGDSTLSVLRMLLWHRADAGADWEPVILDGAGQYDAAPESGESIPVDVKVSYFETLTIHAHLGSLTFSSNTLMGTVSAPIPFEDYTRHEWAVFTIPVDVRWRELEGPHDYRVVGSCNGAPCSTPGGPPVVPSEVPEAYLDALDPDLTEIVIDPSTPAAEGYIPPVFVTPPFHLGGTAFWQQWSGGHRPTYSFFQGSLPGQRCLQASAIRFEAILAEPPPELSMLLDQTGWQGAFFNQNLDYTDTTRALAHRAQLEAFRTGLVLWISRTGNDGTCYLPTRDLVVQFAVQCLAAADGGEIAGCLSR